MAHPPRASLRTLYPSPSATVNRRRDKTDLRAPTACWRSTGFPGRRLRDQATFGKSDAVDQDHAEDEADEARHDPEPPVEFRQIDRGERKRRRQDQRDQHHSDDRADPEKREITEG